MAWPGPFQLPRAYTHLPRPEEAYTAPRDGALEWGEWSSPARLSYLYEPPLAQHPIALDTTCRMPPRQLMLNTLRLSALPLLRSLLGYPLTN